MKDYPTIGHYVVVLTVGGHRAIQEYADIEPAVLLHKCTVTQFALCPPTDAWECMVCKVHEIDPVADNVTVDVIMHTVKPAYEEDFGDLEPIFMGQPKHVH